MNIYLLQKNNKLNQKINYFVSLFLILIIFFSPLSVSRAAINKQINYQGKLTTSLGVAVANGTYNMEFKLYDAPTAGATLWTETRTTTNRVQVTNGLFSVLLGEVATLAGVDFNQTLYLGVNIGGTAGAPVWDGEMTPRKKLGAVPAAVVSETVTAAAQPAITSVGTLSSLTMGGTLALGSNNITSTGSLGATGARLTKGWFTDLEVTNAIVGSVTGSAGSLSGATFASPGAIGSTTPGSGAFTTLTSSGNTTLATGINTINTFGSGSSSINTIGSATTPGALTLRGATTVENNTLTVAGNFLTSLGGNLTVTGTAFTMTPTISGLITATLGLTSPSNISTTGTGTITSAGLLTASNGFTLTAGTLTLPANSVTDAFVSDTLTSSLFVGSGSTTTAIDLATAEVFGILGITNGGTGSNTQNFVDLTTVQTAAGAKTWSGLGTFNAGVTIAASQNLTMNSGTGVFAQGFSSGSTGTAETKTITNTNSSGTASIVNGLGLTLVGTTNSNANANTIVGINFPNVTPIANNAFNGITFGTGFNNFLTSPTINISAAGVITGASIATTQLTGTLQAAQFPALTGDVTTVSGALATTLATVNSNVGSFGSSTSIPSFTVNGKGLITAASGNVVIAPAGTLTGTVLNATVVTSSLTSVGALTSGSIASGFGTIATANTITTSSNISTTGTGTITSAGLLTASNGFTLTAGTLTLPANSVTDAFVSDTLTSSLFVGSGSTTFAIDLATAEVDGILAIANGGTGSSTQNFVDLTTAQTVGGIKSFTALINANAGVTLGANQNLTMSSGTGVFAQTYVNTFAGSAFSQSVTNNNASASAIAINGYDITQINGTNANNTNTNNGINFNAATNTNSNTINGINFASATGYTNFLKTPSLIITSAGNITGAGTIGSGAITSTGIISGTQLTSTVSTGTAPLIVTSTTNVANLNASFLNGAIFASPGPIGSTSASTGAFTTLTSSGNTTLATGINTINTFGSGSSSSNTIGAVSTPGALTLHGVTTLDNTLTISGSFLTSLGGNLTVTGTAWTATPTISGLITATSGLTANGLITANAGLTVAASQNLTMSSGAGVFAQTYVNTTAGSAETKSITNNNTGVGAVIVNGYDITQVNANNTNNTNTNNGLNFNAATNTNSNTINGINFASATGYTNFLQTPSLIITGAGAITGATGITSATGNVAITAGALTLGGTTRITNAGVGTFITGSVIGSQTFTTNNITDSGALTLQTTAANLILQPSGAGTTGSVQIGAGNGGAGSTAPDLLVLDRVSSGGLPTGVNGAIVLDLNGKFNIFESGAWKILCNTTDAACGSGSGTSLSSITAAIGSNTINSGNNPQVWNWAQTTAAQTAFTFGENIASTNGAGAQYILSASTIALSTAAPFNVIARGNKIVDTTFLGGLTLGNTTAAQDVQFFSSANKITSAGALTIAGAITAATSSNTINGLIINGATQTLSANNITNSGALTIATTSANLILQPSGAGTTGNVVIGAANGGAGSTTPDLLVVDKTSGAPPTGVEGSILLSSTGKFSVYEGGSWKILCNTTDAACGAGSGAALSAISAAISGNTINNGNNAQEWNWAQTTAAQTAFTFGENIASTNGAGAQYILSASTIALSTAAPFNVIARGNKIVDTTFLGGLTLGNTTAAQDVQFFSSANKITSAGALTVASTITGTQLTSTIAFGTAPLVVTSSTNVANLNASLLNGATFAAPGAIGGGTASAGTFTTLTANTSITNTALSTAGVVTNTAGGLLGTLAGTTSTVLHGNAAGLPTFSSVVGGDLATNITISTTGNISTTSTGTITSAGLLTASNGLTLTTGALNLTATSGALALSGLTASSINTGANALTITASNFNTTATGINSTAIGTTTPSTGAFTTLSASGLISANGGLTLAATQNLTMLSGTGVFAQTYVNTIAGSAFSQSITNNNASVSAIAINGYDITQINGTNANNTNTNNGINFNAATNTNSNTINGINFASATGYTNFLKTPSLVITSAGNITGAGTIASGAITSTGIISGTQLTSTVSTGTAPLIVTSTTPVANLSIGGSAGSVINALTMNNSGSGAASGTTFNGGTAQTISYNTVGASPLAGSTSLITVGTITTGTWNAGAVTSSGAIQGTILTATTAASGLVIGTGVNATTLTSTAATSGKAISFPNAAGTLALTTDITGGTLAGSFTTLTSSGNSTIGTGASLTNTFGSGASNTNTIGGGAFSINTIGSATTPGALTLRGATTVDNNTLTVAGNFLTSLGGNLTVAGTAVITTDLTVGGPIYRYAAGTGYLNGGFNTVEGLGTTSGAIYSIGGSYVPAAGNLGTMFGIGYGYSSGTAAITAGITNLTVPANKWGLYVASNGLATIFLNSNDGAIYANGSIAAGTTINAVTGYRVNGAATAANYLRGDGTNFVSAALGAGDLTGTIPTGVLGNSVLFIGTTSIALNRTSLAQGLTGITGLTPGANFTLNQNSVAVLTSEEAGAVVNTLYLKTGLVGVQTTTPTANLTVAQSTAGVGTVSNLIGGTTVTGVGTIFTNTFKIGDTITIVGQTVAISAIASDTSMTTAAITNANTTVAYTLVGGTRFVVQGSGNVGIGTTTPGQKLSVAGNIALSTDGTIYGSTTNPFLTLSNSSGTILGYATSALDINASRFDFNRSIITSGTVTALALVITNYSDAGGAGIDGNSSIITKGTRTMGTGPTSSYNIGTETTWTSLKTNSTANSIGVRDNFSPSNVNTAYTAINLFPIINQTGGAGTGTIIGLDYNPTLTALGGAHYAAIFRSGSVGIGVTGPTAVLHLKAGTTGAGTAPLKFTSGTNMTTAEAGAVEWNGTNLFITQTTGPTRQQLAYTTDITGGTLAGSFTTLTSSGNSTIGTGASLTNTFGSGASNTNTIGGGASSINTIGSATTPGTLTLRGATTVENTLTVGNFLTTLGGNLTVTGTAWTATPTISGLITASAGLTASAGNVAITGGVLSLAGTTRISNTGVGTFITGTVIGSQTFTTNNITDSGALSISTGSATALTLNAGTTGVINIGSVSSGDVNIAAQGTGNILLGGGSASTGCTILNASGNFACTGTGSFSNLSGTNTGDVTLAAIGATPNANAATLTGQVLNLQPADGSFGGVVTTGAQTFAGLKTFNGGITLAANQNLTMTSGTGQLVQTYTGTTTPAASITATALTTGNILTLSNTSTVATSSRGVAVDHTATYVTTQAVSGNLLNLTRALTSGASGVVTLSGAVAALSSNCTLATGTCTDSGNILSLTQSNASASGAVLTFSNAGSGVDVLGSGSTWQVTKAGVATFTSTTGGAGSFTTLTSSGNTTLGTGANSINTIGSATTPGTLTLRGATTVENTLTVGNFLTTLGGNLTVTGTAWTATPTISGLITASAGLTASAGNVAITGGVLSLAGTTRISNTGVGTFITGTVIGSQTFTTNNITDSGALSISTGSATALTLNAGTTGVINIGSVSSGDVNIAAQGTGNILLGGGSASTGCTILNASGNFACTGTGSFSNLSGTNTGDVTLAAIGATPNANAATLTGQVLNLQPADGSFGGVVTTGAQTFAGLKTFNGGITLAANQNLTMTSGTGLFAQTFTGTTTTANTITANSLTTGIGLDVNTTNTAVTSTALSAISFDLINAQATTANTAGVTGLAVNFTNNPSVAGNTENAVRIQNQLTANTTDVAVASLLLLDNADTSAGGSTVVTDALRITNSGAIAAGITNGINFASTTIGTAINFSSTPTTNYISGTNFTVTAAGALTVASTISGTQLTSTVTTGTAPLVVASTTNVANLNASSLNGATFAIPGPIGSTTASTGAFTTLTSSGASTIATGSTTNTFGSGTSSINTIGSTTTPGTLTLLGTTIVAGSANTTAFTLGNVTTNPTLTLSGTGLTTLGGNLTVTGTAWTATPTISGLITATSGLTSTGTLTANGTFTANGIVNLGDGGDAITVNSSAWDISSAGAVSGVTTLGLSGAITGATATNTINGMIINAGAVSGVTTLAMTGAITGATGYNGLVITANTGVVTAGTWSATALVDSAVSDTLTSSLFVGSGSTTTAIDLATAEVAGILPIGNGGTGNTTAAAAFNALSPMTTGGDLIYGGASGVGTRLANGSAGQVLQSNGTTLAPSWVAGGGGGANALGTYIVQTATNAPANAQILAALGTGIVKNTTTTGVLSIAVAGDFPTLNQNTTGTSGGLTGTPNITVGTISSGAITSGLINGQNISVAANFTGTVTIATDLTVGGPIYRSAPGTGYLNGGFSTIETAGTTAGAIYSIGGTFVPGVGAGATGAGALGTMYGIGYGYSSGTAAITAGITNLTVPVNKWGMYVASNGVSRIFLNSNDGNIYANGSIAAGTTINAVTGYQVNGAATTANYLRGNGTNFVSSTIQAGDIPALAYVPYTGATANVNLGNFSLSLGSTTPTFLQANRGATSGSQMILANTYAPTIGGVYSSAEAFFASNAYQTTDAVDAWTKSSSTYSSSIITLGLSTATNSTAFQVRSSPANTVGGTFANFFPNSLFTILETGNVGIGLTAPTANLQVAQSTSGVGTISVLIGGTAWTGVGTQFLNTFKVGDTITSAGQTLTISAIASDTALTTNAVGAAITAQPYTLVGGTRFSVLGNGNVGIGTTGPWAKLQVAGGHIGMDSGNFIGTANSAGVLTFGAGQGGTFQGGYITSYGGTHARLGDLSLHAGSQSGASPEVMTIDYLGNVGIGTTTPVQALDFGGPLKNIRFSSYTHVGETGSDLGMILGNNIKASIAVNGQMEISGSATDAATAIRLVYSDGIRFVTVPQSHGLTVGTAVSAATYGKMRLSLAGGLSLGNGYVGTDPGAGNMIITGNVGIGVTAPARKLSVIAGATNGAYFGPDINDGVLVGYQPSAGLVEIIGINEAISVYNDLGLRAGNSTQLYLKTDGNVGIGTTNPGQKLHIEGASASSVAQTIRNTQAGTGALTSFRMGNDLAVNRLEVFTLSSTYTASGLYQPDGSSIANEGTGGLGIGGVHASGNLRFYTGGAGDANERIRILSGGNVGIGTTGPGAILNTKPGAVSVTGLANAVTNSSGFFEAGGGPSWGLSVGYVSTGNVMELQALDKAQTTATTLALNPYGGNVGIGTTGPTSLLDVRGTLAVGDARNGRNFADFGGEGTTAFTSVSTLTNPTNFVSIRPASVAPASGTGDISIFRTGTGSLNPTGASTLGATAIFDAPAKGGAGTFTNMATVYITGAPTGGTNNAALVVASGNVGIGTTSPSSTLFVNGTIRNSSNVNSTGDPGLAIVSGDRLGFDQSGTRSWSVKATGGNLAFASGDGNGVYSFSNVVSAVTGYQVNGTATTANYLRGNGTNFVSSAIQAADVPTLNQNTSGTAAGLSVTLVATSGGTGQSTYAVGDLLVGGATNTLAKLADVATGSVLISGGVGVAPAWSTTPTFVGTNISGTAASLNIGGSAGSATNSTNATNTAITDDTTTAATMYPTWVTAATGNLPQKVSSTKLSFIPSTGILTATGFAGPLTGNVTGNVSGTAATITGVYGGTITSSQVTTGLGFTPYNATNPAGYTTNTGTVTSVATAGNVNGITLTGGTITTSGTLTLGGTLSVPASIVTAGTFAAGNFALSGTAVLTATTFSGALSGNATTASNLTGTPNITVGTISSGIQTVNGDAYTTYGPNSTWGAYIRVGGNGRTVGAVANYASVVATDGNLHLDAGTTKTTYLNYYAGTGGTIFGNGAGGVSGANVSAAGVMTATNFSGPGTGLTGTAASLSIGGNAGSATILQTARNINGVSFNGSANILVPSIYDAEYRRITNPGGAEYVTQAASVTGAIAITMPVWTGGMYKMTVEIYEYVTNESFTVVIGGHNSDVTWYNEFGYILANPSMDRRFTIRYGRTTGGLPIIYIGELGSTWSYPQVFVTDFQHGFSGNQVAFATGWSIGFEITAFQGVTRTQTLAQIGYALSTNTANTNVLRDASGNFSAGTITATNFSGPGTGLTGTAAGLSIGGNAETVDSFSASQSIVGNNIVVRDANGYIFGNYFNSTDDVSAGTLTYLMGKFGDNYYRSATAAKVATFISGQTMNIVGSATTVTQAAQTVITSVGALTGGSIASGFGTIATANTITGSNLSGTHSGTSSGTNTGDQTTITGNAGTVTNGMYLNVQNNMSGTIGRSAHAAGFQVGSYNSVGANDANTNPIYTIGSAYNPTATSLTGSYGVGYSHSNFWGASKPTGWGFYGWENGTVNFVAAGSGAWTAGTLTAVGALSASNFSGTHSGSSSGTNTGDQTLSGLGGVPTTRILTAGTGLTGGGDLSADRTFNIGAGTCITTNADDVAVTGDCIGDTQLAFNTGQHLTTASSPTFAAETVGTLYFAGVGGNSGQAAPGSDYRIYQAPGAWTAPYPDLNIAWHTGISLGALSAYGGTRFYNNSDMVTELMSVGNTDNHVRVSNNLYVTGLVTGGTYNGQTINGTANFTGTTNTVGAASAYSHQGNANVGGTGNASYHPSGIYSLGHNWLYGGISMNTGAITGAGAITSSSTITGASFSGAGTGLTGTAASLTSGNTQSINGAAYTISGTTGTSYSNAVQVREANLGGAQGGGAPHSTFQPRLGFHWGGVVASSITMENSGRIAIVNNPGTGYENFIANTITGASFVGPLTGNVTGNVSGSALTVTQAAQTVITSVGALAGGSIAAGFGTIASGNITVGGGTGKLTVGTIDPVYTIGGINYATYASGTIGIKEEVMGTINTMIEVPNVGYKQVIDFKNAPIGSDIWLFARASNIKKHIGQLSVLLSPGGNARTWYKVDETNYTLTIYSSIPTEVSFRLASPRFDADEWTNYNYDVGVTGFVVPEDLGFPGATVEAPDTETISPEFKIAVLETSYVAMDTRLKALELISTANIADIVTIKQTIQDINLSLTGIDARLVALEAQMASVSASSTSSANILQVLTESLGQYAISFFTDVIIKVENSVAYMKGIVVDTLQVGSKEVPVGITMFTPDGSPYCVSLNLAGVPISNPGVCIPLAAVPQVLTTSTTSTSSGQTTPPVITLTAYNLEINSVSVALGSVYLEAGATAVDSTGSSVAVVISGSVDTNTIGTYTIFYTAQDGAGNITEATRTVNVVAVLDPAPAPTTDTTTTTTDTTTTTTTL